MIWSLTSLGMMLCLLPPWIEPTVITAGSVGLVSRLMIVCRSRTSRAAMTTTAAAAKKSQAPAAAKKETITRTYPVADIVQLMNKRRIKRVPTNARSLVPYP